VPTDRRFAAAVFDMDGLLIDSERPMFDAWIEAARQLDCAFDPELLRRVLGRPGAEGVALFRASLGDAFPYDAVRARVQELLVAPRAAGFSVMPGVRALLDRCRAQEVPCAVASSTRRLQLEERLTRCGLHPLFAAFAGGDEVAHGKPAPDIFLLAAERIGVDPHDCLVFEDSEHGARGALAAGMQVVIVPDLTHPSDEARGLCLAVLSSLVEVEQHFEIWFAGASEGRMSRVIERDM
jgi:HAD superfamily hydrolase (TIGR01509 family)